MKRLKRVTLEQIKGFNPYFSPKDKFPHLINQFPKGATALEILSLKEVSPSDRMWLVLREAYLPENLCRLFAANCAAKGLRDEAKRGRKPHKDSYAAVRLARKLAQGIKISEDAWSATWAAARSAARSAAESAARSAAESAARSAAESAAWAAARSADRSAWAAVESAAWSADRSAWAAARSADRSATWAAARSAAEERQIKELVKLIKKAGYSK